MPITPTRSHVTGDATASERGGRRLELILPATIALLLAGVMPATAADVEKARIYRCEIDGKKVTRDRPIAECADRIQYLLNGDGSVNREIPPTLTVEEREKKEAADLAREIKESRIKQEIRVDRNLMQLYPNEAVHRKARDKALLESQTSVRKLEERIVELKKERVPLDLERQFYEPVGKPLPVALKAKIEANEASLNAQRDLVQGQQGEVARINATYDVELTRLRKLWSGAQPGSLGPLPGTQQAATAAAATPAAMTARTPEAAGKTTLK